MTTAHDARLAEIEARDPAPEGWEQRVEAAARAIMDADYEQATGGLMNWVDDLDENERNDFRRLAAAALTADATWQAEQ